ncbi:MAG: endonuclease/exonuclease/phosphatase family protein [Opitutae bacterium]|nr:endonuclease/exonuclease/phosphatase family protein [Opitutae bacterium]
MARYRFLTFNIAHARGASPIHQSLRTAVGLKANLRKIARLIERLQVDIVALQEIDQNSRWAGSFDHLAYLKAHTGLAHAVHGVTNRRPGFYQLNYGNALLSRYPIHHHETVAFGRSLFGKKGFLFAEIDAPEGRLPLVNIHLNHNSRPRRLQQVAHLMRHLEDLGRHRAAHWRTPPMVCGDFNTPSHRPDATATLLGYFERTNNYTLLPKTGHTFPSAWPARALDYVLLPEECRAPRAKIVRSLLSDHQPVLVEFELD